ncbi:ATP-grasp domain-containing protein [Phytohabitans flavus]|uniref:ATP-grasp domain-containing protein n=1 Tax=Phytohabitans flavus TaxID=1076124 RepID=UPI003643D17E
MPVRRPAPGRPGHGRAVRCGPVRRRAGRRGAGTSFVTVDLARRSDGAWRVVELGDGQVSDRPPALSAGALVAAVR